MIRTFIAASLESKVIENIADASTRLQSEIDGVRWLPPANFHLTLKFLGSIDEGLVDAIGEALRQPLQLFPRFTINVKGLGVFPSPKRPRVLWVGLSSDHIINLASRVATALQPLGFAPESRPFMPHLTIGRWGQARVATKSLGQQLEKWKAHNFGSSDVERVKLIQSLLKPSGASYHDLLTIPLGANPIGQ